MTDRILNVPQYYPQTDSRTAHADRMCFSSTMAMAIKYLWPESLQGSNADDDYLRTVLKYGDTTNALAQIMAAHNYKAKATLFKNGKLQDLKDRIDAGLPVPVGFLHHGPASAPRGGGHWALLVGLTSTHAVFHDPYGELDNVNGGYVRVGPFGRNIQYSLKNWLPRWTAGGEAWFMDVRRIEDPKLEAKPYLDYDGSWQSVETMAKAAGARFPEVVAAQWALESGFGKHQSGVNNFFGIKGSPGTPQETKEFLDGKWVTVTATFKNFATPYGCVNELVEHWYRDFKGYKGVNRAPNAEACAHLLVTEGYATDPAYAGKLIKLIREHQ